MRKTANEVRQILAEEFDMEIVESLSLFDAPAYAEAIIGMTHDNRVIYDYEKIVEHLMKHDGMEYDEAMEFVDYNVIRTLPYMPNAPIIMMSSITISD